MFGSTNHQLFPHAHSQPLSGSVFLCLSDGGVQIDAKCRALMPASDGGQPVRGLYAAGECTGGVHGFDRLGGNSLLECVVFGRTAGLEASRFAAEVR